METLLGRLVRCRRCDALVLTGDMGRSESHMAAHHREEVVSALAMEMNRRGVDFQPGQRYGVKRGPAAARRLQRRRAAAHG